MSQRLTSFTMVLLVAAHLVGCDEENGSNERRTLRERDQDAALSLVRLDLNRGVTGVRRAAEYAASRLVIEDEERRERELRQVFQRIRRPPRAVEELMLTPITFLAAVGTDGEVVARETDPDPMRGYDLAAVAPVVRRALEEGQSGYELTELPAQLDSGEESSSETILFAAPARREGRIVGAVAAGLPLWRLSQQLSRQLQLDNAEQLQQGHLVWALVYRGDQLHHSAGFPPGLVEITPNAAARAEGLARSSGGYTGEVQQYGRWYGYLILPLPSVGRDVGLVLFRSDPP